MSRGEKPAIKRTSDTPPEGIPAPGLILVVHAGKGYRWVPAELRKKKERHGYEFVREYAAGDEIAAMPLEDMTPDQLRARAEVMQKMAGDKDAQAERKLNDTEKEYAANEAKKAAEEAARKARASKTKAQSAAR